MRVASIRRGTVASAIPQLYPFGWCALMRVSAIRCAMFDCVCQLLLACRRLAHSCCDYVFVARFRFCHADRVGEPSREARPAQNCQSRKNQVLTKRSSDSRSARRFTPLPLPARRCTREGRGTSMSLRWHRVQTTRGGPPRPRTGVVQAGEAPRMAGPSQSLTGSGQD